MAKEFHSHGKLLLTGEYAVLDGALALAVPTSYGQSFSVEDIDAPRLSWASFDENRKIWFRTVFDLQLFNSDAILAENDPIAETLLKILREAQRLNPNFLKHGQGYEVITRLDFPRDWGLGSSSTLINNMAQWAKIDAYELLWNTFSGSGYDIACAQHNHPILYRRKNERTHSQHKGTTSWPIAEVEEVDFNPSFRDQLYFIHLNKKQNTREGIAAYQKKVFDKVRLVEKLSETTRKTVSCKCLSDFESLMTEHEALLSKILQIPTVKESLFPDFKGAIKSLGAWGGDFVLATGDDSTPSYFEGLGYGTVVPYSEMVLAQSG